TGKAGSAEQGPSAECCIIYSNAFDEVIEYVTAYKNILTSIKQEYEVFIARMRLKALESESTTLLHCRKRAMELEDNFSELLESRQYDAAATYAVNSPKGILCNEEALNTAAGHLPNSAITLETIKCALSEKQLNLVTHWVKQQRLTFSEVDTIYDYGKVEPSNKSKCLALAQVMYGQSCAHREVALCL
ncbi:PREDICTED: clathrin heavy chain linker domain-containing protein 1, partial [Cariama cristata]|uniref:clathrin heavy chain linker domain-containing protein 1 n=1 Tax=Cariama cristata TaxID=54380 RepID=UPI0005205735